MASGQHNGVSVGEDEHGGDHGHDHDGPAHIVDDSKLDFHAITSKFQPLWQHPTSVWSGHGHRAVGWAELFYDLLYVAAAVKLAEILKHGITVFSIVTFCVICLSFWQCWYNYTIYFNRYTGDSFVHEFLFGTHSISVLGMLMSIRTENGGNDGIGYGNERFFALWIAFNRGTLFLAFLWARIKVKHDSFMNTIHCVIYFLCGTMCLFFFGFAVDHKVASVALLPVLMGVVVADNFEMWFLHKGRFNKTHELYVGYHVHHLTERFGLLMMILLGETIMSITGLDMPDPRTSTTASLARFLSSLVCAYGTAFYLRTYYFTVCDVDNFHALYRHKCFGAMWQWSHMLLGTGLVMKGVGWYLNTKYAPTKYLKSKYGYLLAISIGMCNLAVGMIRLSHMAGRPFNVFLFKDKPPTKFYVIQGLWWGHTFFAVVLPIITCAICVAAKAEPAIYGFLLFIESMGYVFVDGRCAFYFSKFVDNVVASRESLWQGTAGAKEQVPLVSAEQQKAKSPDKVIQVQAEEPALAPPEKGRATPVKLDPII